MRARRAQQPPPPPFIGDRTAGCACAYEFRPRPPRSSNPAAKSDALQFTDAFESATGVRFVRPPCHSLVTRNANAGPATPPPHVPRDPKKRFFDVIDAARRAFWAAMSFLFPKINPSVGISFWQWRPGL